MESGWRVTRKERILRQNREKLPSQMLPAGVDPNCPMVALTFDDGPKASVTNRILNSLEANGGRATFFMVGSNITAGNIPTIQRMAAMNCEVANHTNDHKYLSKIGAEHYQPGTDYQPEDSECVRRRSNGAPARRLL